MKVLHVIDALGVGGGAEHSLVAQLPLLRRLGVTSSVACIFPREGGLQADLRAQGFDVEVLPATSWPGRIQTLRRKIEAEAPDLVHATLLSSCLLTRLACVGLRIPQINSLVSTSYDPARVSERTIHPWKLRAVQTIDEFSARNLVEHFHAITDAVRREAIEVLGIEPQRVTVIPRGRSAALLGEASPARRREARWRLGIGEDTPVVLNVGRQDHPKAQDHLIRAFARLQADWPDAVLLIAGREGAATPRIQQALTDAGIGDAVRLLGHRTDIPDLLAASDVFAFPSLYEGLGCSLIEAMALSTPIVGSDADAIAEVLDGGNYGIVVPRGDEVGLAETMAELLSDPTRRVELARRARGRFLERYELDRVVEATAEMYEAVLARAKAEVVLS